MAARNQQASHMTTQKLTIAALREERGETLEQFAEALGLSSKGLASWQLAGMIAYSATTGSLPCSRS